MFDGTKCYLPIGASGFGIWVGGVAMGPCDGWPYVVLGIWVMYYGLVYVNKFEQRDIDDGVRKE